MSEYAIVAIPKSDALSAIERVRTRLDPQSGLLPAHVTLVFPFTHERGEDVVAHMRCVANETAPFEMTLDEISVVDDEYLFLDIGKGAAEVIALHKELYRGPLVEHLSRDRQFRPHVTIGRMSDLERVRHEALNVGREIPLPVQATVDAIALFRLRSSGLGETVLTIPLANSTDGNAAR